MDFRKLKLNTRGHKKPTDPIELFNSLTLRGTVQNIWDTQAEALRTWDSDYRTKNDVAIEMNTGGGKTLVGLLVAQATVNETRGQVLYVCANNQLIGQTAQKARECGIEFASRLERTWQNDKAFYAGDVFCITNYASVFNGFSVFRNDDISAIVFDDAHVAENVIRDCYTLTFDSDSPVHKQLLAIFTAYFKGSSQAESYDEMLCGDRSKILFVPQFLTWTQVDEVRQVLQDNDVADGAQSKYPWEHIKDNVKSCCFLLSHRRIQIVPPVIPLHRCPSFSEGTRRVYLTATMPSRSSFIRTFGVTDLAIISPSGKSGDAQRLFVFVPGDDDEQQKDMALRYTSQRKACVISPSKYQLELWGEEVNVFDRKSGEEEIERFRKSTEPERLGLAARYDGIDLPGDSCRMLILDHLPFGESLYSEFIDQTIKTGTLRSAHTATRIIQAIGRIFRSNTDHGVVMLRGNDLQRWLTVPRNRAFLPPLLQKQIGLGMALADEVATGKTTYEQLIEAVLLGDSGWDALYKDYINEFGHEEDSHTLDWFEGALIQERDAFYLLWDGHYQKAATHYTNLAKDVAAEDENLVAWYKHWAGLCYLASDVDTAASRYFSQAANVRSELGRLPTKDITIEASETQPGFQAMGLTKGFTKAKYVKTIAGIRENLRYGEKTNPAEESLKELGLILGLEASRPDKETGSGPDVLWMGERIGAAFELKTNNTSGEYSKDDIKDCNDHCVWLEKNYSQKYIHKFLVGKHQAVAKIANPDYGLRVIEIEALIDLVERLDTAIASFAASEITATYAQSVLEAYGLVWPACVTSLPYKLAIDLQNME